MIREITLNINGQSHIINVDPDTPLLYVLRNDLGLKGAKFACGMEQCGACKVIIDGDAVPSCRLSVRSVQDREITTIEGIGTRKNLHPLQKAFMEEQAVQCGYCTSGMIMAAKALLDQNPKPTDEEIKAEMSGNLCRCGVYDRILRAIKRAAGIYQEGPVWKEGLKKKSTYMDGDKFQSAVDGLAGSLMHTPGIDSWIRVDKDETITIFTGKVEIGQDIKTAVAMIGAEELDVSMKRIMVVSGDTARTPDEGYTAGSMSMETTGNAIRNAAAEARQILINQAREKLEAPDQDLIVTDGTVTDPSTGRSITYWDLFGGKKFECNVMEIGKLKNPEDYKIVGQAINRLDIMSKVTGESFFIQDMELEGMVHARIIRPPDYESRLVSLPEDIVDQIQGVIKVVRDGSFLGVIAEREEQAVEAAKLIKKNAIWKTGAGLPSQSTLFEDLKKQPSQPFLIVKGRTVEDPVPPIEIPENAFSTLSATYYRPYQMHASLGPSASVAYIADDKLTVWSHSQGPFFLRSAIAHVLGMNNDDVRVIHVDGPGCYGHNGADDAAMDAALLARAIPGRPVSLKWMRDDENAWEPYGPAMIMELQASIDEKGHIIDWNYDIFSQNDMGRPHPDRDGGSGLLASWHLEKPFEPQKMPSGKTPMFGSSRNADPLYAFPKQRVVNHSLAGGPLRTSAHRGLGSYANVFAIESFMDELAHAAEMDPIEFRLNHLTDERARAVIEAVAELSQWEARGEGGKDTGKGLGFIRYKNNQSYVAVVVDLTVNRKEGLISLEKAFIVADAGQLVNPDGVSSQLEGAFLQSASWTLKEQVSFDEHGITSLDWHSYPILRFHNAPKVEIMLLNRPGQPYMGVGEGAMGPIPAAISNAVFHATGIRLRRIPFTPVSFKDALKSRDVSL